MHIQLFNDPRLCECKAIHFYMIILFFRSFQRVLVDGSRGSNHVCDDRIIILSLIPHKVIEQSVTHNLMYHHVRDTCVFALG